MRQFVALRIHTDTRFESACLVWSHVALKGVEVALLLDQLEGNHPCDTLLAIGISAQGDELQSDGEGRPDLLYG